MPLSIGQVLQDRYRIIALVEQGGMGAVYRAHDLRLNKRVALKELLPQPGLDADTLNHLRAQFKKEAQTLAQLDQPHPRRDQCLRVPGAPGAGLPAAGAAGLHRLLRGADGGGG